jgi:hypothetical protein
MLNCCPKLEELWRKLKRLGKPATIIAFLALFGFLIFHVGAASYSNYAKQQYQHQTAAVSTPKKPPLGSWWEWTTHDPVAFYTSVLSAFTALLFISTVLLWWSTRRGIQTQSEDTRILQRAYVAVEPMGLLPVGSSDTNGHYRIQNAGRLPARNIRWYAYVRNSAGQDERLFEINENDLYGNNVLAAGAGMTHGTGATAMGNGYVYVWGIVRYDDGFGNQRFTKFCHRYNTHAARPFDATGRNCVPAETGRHHGYGNSTDETE